MTQATPESNSTDERAPDPLLVSKRVVSIGDIVQTGGSLSYTLTTTPDLLTPHFEPVAARVVDRLADSLTISVSFGFAGYDAETTDLDVFRFDEAPVRVEATFLASYTLRNTENLLDSDFDAFAEINGELNLTPYWREYLHSSLGRVGLRPYLVPPFDGLKRLREFREAHAKANPENDAGAGKPATDIRSDK